MKISKQTLELLKNFSGINQNLYIEPGKTLETMTVARNIVVYADVPEEFPQAFGIYNLNEFMGALSLFNDPDIEFGEKSLKIKEGKTSVTYYYAEKEVLVTAKKGLKMPSADATFTLTKDQLQSLTKSAGILGAQDISFVGNGSVIKAVVGDNSNDTANTFAIEVGETDQTFDVHFKVENLKMIPQDYTVEVSSKLISRFVNEKANYVMFVALEKNSTFN